MEAGRKMDKLVAEHVMGGAGVAWGNSVLELKRLEHNRTTQRVVPNYSTDEDAAWTVVRAMWEKGYCVWLENPAQLCGCVDAAFSAYWQSDGAGTSESFPEAICAAALRALGVGK